MRHRIAAPDNTWTTATPKQKTSEIGVRVHTSNQLSAIILRTKPENRAAEGAGVDPTIMKLESHPIRDYIKEVLKYVLYYSQTVSEISPDVLGRILVWYR